MPTALTKEGEREFASARQIAEESGAEWHFPIEFDDILLDELEVREPSCCETASLVAVRPCDPRYGGNTYLGVVVGELPTEIGLQRQICERGEELVVVAEEYNPLIAIPQLNVAVWGYESWWRPIDNMGLKDISDQEILLQPCMAALIESSQVDCGTF